MYLSMDCDDLFLDRCSTLTGKSYIFALRSQYSIFLRIINRIIWWHTCTVSFQAEEY